MPVAHRQRARDTLSCRASAQSAIGVGYNLHRYQGQQQLLVVKARSIDHLSAAAYCGYGDGFNQARNALLAARDRQQRFERGLLADAGRVAKAAEFAYTKGAMGLMDLHDGNAQAPC